MRTQIAATVAALVLVCLSGACLPGAYGEQLAWPTYSDSGFGFEDSGTSAYLGVDISEVTPERVGPLKLKEEQGVEVLMVDQDSPAGKAGLKEHDVILTLNGVEVESGAQLRRMIHETPPGRTVTLQISRDGQAQTVKAQLADRQKALAWKSDDRHSVFVEPPMAPIPPIPPIPNFAEMEIPNIVVVHSSMRSGLMVENLTPQLGEFFGAKGGKGILVRSVETGSAAAKAGLRAGDVIVKINNEAVADISDFSHALRSHSGGNATVGVIRDKREQTISLPIPEHKRSELMEESLDTPDVENSADIDLSEITENIARLEPTIQRWAGHDAQRALESAQKVLRENHVQWKIDQEKMSQALKKWQKEFEKQQWNTRVLVPSRDMI